MMYSASQMMNFVFKNDELAEEGQERRPRVAPRAALPDPVQRPAPVSRNEEFCKNEVSKTRSCVSKHEEFCIQTDEFGIKNGEFCIQNDEFCSSAVV